MKKFINIWFVALIAKLILSAIIPLSSDENYYWVWSNHLALSYYDHPPMIAWLMYLGHPFENLGSAVRWPTIILGHFTILIWAQILKKYFDEKTMILWLFMTLFNPLAGWGSLIAVPDIPVIFFWSLSIFLILKWRDEKNIYWSSLLGCSLGLGFLSKYHIVLFVPAALLWLSFTKSWRGVKVQHLLVTFLCGFIFSLPVLIWNYNHNFDSFWFQMSHGLNESGPYKLSWTAGYILSQIGLLFPTTVYWLFRKTKIKNLDWLFFFGWLPLILFLFSSFRARVEGNWPILGYPSLVTLSIVNSTSFKWARWTLGIWITCFVIVCTEVLFQWIPIYRDRLKSTEFTRYDPLIEIAKTHKPFYASNFQMASALSYKMKTPIFKLAEMGRRDQFDYFPESQPPKGRYYVAVQVWDTFPAYINTQHIITVTPLGDVFRLAEIYNP